MRNLSADAELAHLSLNTATVRKQGDLAAAKEEFLKVYEVDVSFRDVADRVTRLSQQ